MSAVTIMVAQGIQQKCEKLKGAVQGLINEEKISFQKNAQSNVGKNPLPNHNGPGVNMIGEYKCIERSMEGVQMPMKIVYKEGKDSEDNLKSGRYQWKVLLLW